MIYCVVNTRITLSTIENSISSSLKHHCDSIIICKSDVIIVQTIIYQIDIIVEIIVIIAKTKKSNEIRTLLQKKYVEKKNSKSKFEIWNKKFSTHDAIHFDSISQHERNIWNCITSLLLFLFVELQCFKITNWKHNVTYKATLLRRDNDVLQKHWYLTRKIYHSKKNNCNETKSIKRTLKRCEFNCRISCLYIRSFTNFFLFF